MRFLVIIIAVLLCSPALQAASLEQQRGLFQEARKALDQHQLKRFDALKNKLQDYPLTPYLDIWHARKQLAKGDDTLVAAALAAYADVPETIDLRRAWLKYLAKNSRWNDAQHIFDDIPSLTSRFPEIAMLSNWYVGDKAEALQQFTGRWKQGKAVTSRSKPLYRIWLKQGHPSKFERWHRIDSFAKKGYWKKTHSLTRSFSKQQKQWLSYWRQVQKRPEKTLSAWPESLSKQDVRIPATLIMSDAIKRLSRKDVVQAWKYLQRFQQTQKYMDTALFFNLERIIALRGSREHKQEAAIWLAELPESFQNEDTRAWQVRLALIARNWIKVLVVIGSMPQSERQQDRWVYWLAQALQSIGDDQQAILLLAKLAQGRGYYNFLSAEQLALPFRLEASKIIASDQMMTAVKQLPGIIRAYEWLQVNKRSKASREWNFTLAGVDKAHWKAAALLASEWHWDDQVIRAAFKADEMDALFERFPLSYEKLVMQAAKKTGLEAAAIWSIIRQESAFNEHAVSYVGAKGLMQLMPATARHVAHKLHMSKGTPRLFSAATNIRLGTTYLAGIKQRFGNLALAAAGYNAGPHRVSTWLKRVSFDLPEAWIEVIPFNETRRYVQQVMAFVTVYEWRQHKSPSSLVSRLYGRMQEVSFNQSVLIYDVELD